MGLTDREIRYAKVPAGLNQRELRDQKVQGLVLRVYKTGKRVWFVFYRRKEDNRRRYLKLGAYPGISLAQARELAEVELGKIAAGEDPQADRAAAREQAEVEVETVAELSKLYLERYAKPFKRPRGYAMDRWQLATYVLPRWGDRPIDGITKQDVRGLVQDLAEGRLAVKGKPTKVAPRNLRALLSKLFDWATEEGLLPGNPAAGVKLPMPVREHLKKGGRDRVLSDDEIGALWRELDWLDALAARQHQTPVSAAAFRLILLTAQRPGEVFRMRWRDIEDGAWWVVPAEVAKNGESNRVPLSPQTKRILRRLQPYTGGSEWVLESPYKKGSPLTTVKAASHGIVRRAGMRPWTPHDLRRTAVSKMRALGVDRRVVQAILNHKDPEITAVYDRYSMDPEKEQALAVWGRRVEEIVVGGASAAAGPFLVRPAGPRIRETDMDSRRSDRRQP